MALNILLLIGIIIAVIIIAMVLIFKYVVIPKLDAIARPLSEDELKICEKLVKDGKAIPFICKRALKLGKCPCLPCSHLEKAKVI